MDFSGSPPPFGMLQFSASPEPEEEGMTSEQVKNSRAYEKGCSSPPAPATTSKSVGTAKAFPSKLATYVSHIAFICHNQLPHSWSLMHMWLLWFTIMHDILLSLPHYWLLLHMWLPCLTILRGYICGWHCLTIGRWCICGCFASLFCGYAYVAGIASLLVVDAYVAAVVHYYA
jgi:hypothetical protein